MRTYKRVRSNGHVSWILDLGLVNGKRVRVTHETEAEALGALELAKIEAKTHGLQSLEISNADRSAWHEWRQKLPAGTTIETVCRFYQSHHQITRQNQTIHQLLNAYSDELFRLKRSDKYIRETLSALKASPICVLDDSKLTFTKEDLLPWICQPGLSPATQVMRRAVLRAFFEWQVANRYLLANPLTGATNRIRIAKVKQTEILSLGPTCAEKLLKAASISKFRSLLGYLTVAMFAGLRPDEIRRTHFSKLDLEGGTIRVSAKAAKTGQTRVIELAPVAVEWLTLWRTLCPNQTEFCVSGFRKKWDALRESAGMLNGWVHDVLRHTFASMHYAMHQNASLLKALMGHSQTENTLFQHYRAVETVAGETITKRMAGEFWALTPKSIGAFMEPRQ